MPLIPINNVGQFGVVSDRRPYELEPNAWTYAKNVRFRNGYAEKFQGHIQVFGTPTVAPYYAFGLSTATALYWVYAGLQKVYVWDGAVHTDLTRATGGDYGATADRNWTHGVIGGIPVLNNGVDEPQMWNPVSLGQRLQRLSNWPTNTLCGALRAFRQFLVALDVTKASVRYSTMVKWSHGAAPGAVPSSWDETDPTKDAGEWELKDTPDAVLDCAPLRDINVLYKENSTHAMQYIGGAAVFRFSKLFDTIGALSRRCVIEFASGRHAVFGDGDIILHDGVSAQSLVSARVRQRIYSTIDSSYYSRSFLAHNRRERELWFCFTEAGNALPNIAWVWNYEQNTSGFRDLQAIAHAALGVVDPGASADQWGLDNASWSSDITIWDARLYDPTAQRLLLAAPNVTRLFMADSTTKFDTTTVTAVLERTGLSIPLRTGQPPDLSVIKHIRYIWPRIDGPQGGVVNVSVAAYNDINGTPIYGAARPFVIGTTQYIECRAAGRLLAIKFESTTDVDWRLHGYEIDVQRRGSI